MPEHPFEDLARSALLQMTPASSIGAFAGSNDEGDGVVTLRFASTLAGYPGWRWTVSIAKIGDDEPTVLETELMPGDGALLAPDWVPWSDRLAEYKAAQQAAEAEAAAAADDPEGDAGDDADADEDDDDDLLGSDVLHGGDLDGVDIDDADPDADVDDDDDAFEDFDEDDDDEDDEVGEDEDSDDEDGENR